MRAVAVFLLALCCLAVSHAWNCNTTPRLSNAWQVDAGMGKVVARDTYGRAFFLSGSAWYRLGSHRLTHVTVGPAGIWGTWSNRVYKFVGGNFRYSTSVAMAQVDAGGNGFVVGVRQRYGHTYCLNWAATRNYFGSGTFGWRYLNAVLKYYSCGPNSCWGVARNSRVLVTQTISPNNCRFGSWASVTGPAMKMIEMATDGNVFGLATNGKVYQRIGLSMRNKRGTRWREVAICQRALHLTYDLHQLWIVTTSRTILRCTP